MTKKIDLAAQFQKEKLERIVSFSKNKKFKKLSLLWFKESLRHEYSYNFEWLGRPIIQYPQDMFAIQELVWQIKPDLIIETGIAHGGSLIFYASLLEMLGGNGKVLGIDIDIRSHNRMAIEQHPMFKRITMIEGSSTDNNVISQVKKIVGRHKKKLIVLDSFHTQPHVLKELELYSPFVSKASYIIVLDTIVEDLPKHFVKNRPWDKGNNPKTAVIEFLRHHRNFQIDKTIENKLLITCAPSGFLKKI